MPTAAEISPQWHIRREEITDVAIAAPTPRPTTVPFDLAAAAPHGRGPTVGLWALSNALFGFNQVFLAVALLAFGIAGTGTGLLADWHGWLGYLGAALLFVSSSRSPYNVERTNRIALIGLIDRLAWIAVAGITLLDLGTS